MDGSFLDVAREVLDRPAFLTDGEDVFWSTAYGPARLDASNVSALLDLPWADRPDPLHDVGVSIFDCYGQPVAVGLRPVDAEAIVERMNALLDESGQQLTRTLEKV